MWGACWPNDRWPPSILILLSMNYAFGLAAAPETPSLFLVGPVCTQNRINWFTMELFSIPEIASKVQHFSSASQLVAINWACCATNKDSRGPATDLNLHRFGQWVIGMCCECCYINLSVIVARMQMISVRWIIHKWVQYLSSYLPFSRLREFWVSLLLNHCFRKLHYQPEIGISFSPTETIDADPGYWCFKEGHQIDYLLLKRRITWANASDKSLYGGWYIYSLKTLSE